MIKIKEKGSWLEMRMKQPERNLEKYLDESLVYVNELEVNRQHLFIIEVINVICVIGCLYVLMTDDREYLMLDLIISGFVMAFFCGFFLFNKVCSIRSLYYKYVSLAWFLIPFMVIVTFGMDNMWLGFTIPIIMSCRYYRIKFVIVVSVLVQISLLISNLLIVYVQPLFGYARASSIPFPSDYPIILDGMGINEMAANMLRDGVVSWSSYQSNHFWNHVVFYCLTIWCVSAIAVMITYQETRTMLRQQAIMEEKNRVNLELVESRNRILLSQIQPHFVFNVLNSIYELCETNVGKAQSMITAFASYLRHDIDSLTQSELIPFEKELDAIVNYLQLEKMRFGDRLRVKMDIDVDDFMIPPLTIQPLVENGVKHGISRKANGGTIRLRTRELEDRFLIQIIDDGVGFMVGEASQDDKQHIGINNSVNRLKNQLGAEVQIESTIDEGTCISIYLPKESVI